MIIVDKYNKYKGLSQPARKHSKFVKQMETLTERSSKNEMFLP